MAIDIVSAAWIGRLPTSVAIWLFYMVLQRELAMGVADAIEGTAGVPAASIRA